MSGGRSGSRGADEGFGAEDRFEVSGVKRGYVQVPTNPRKAGLVLTLSLSCIFQLSIGSSGISYSCLPAIFAS